MTENKLISIVTPAFNEAINLEPTYLGINKIFSQISHDFEWIIVDDHSSDSTWAAIEKIARKDKRVRGIRLSRNFGSHAAMMCGINLSKGDALIALAGDGQEPPSLMVKMLELWAGGVQVIWGARSQNSGSGLFGKLSNKIFYAFLRQSIGNSSMPKYGSDYFLIDRRVIDSLVQFKEKNMNVMSMVSWMGFKSRQVIYDRGERVHGESGWSLSKKIKLVIDSVVSYSVLPIRLMALAGTIIALLGIFYIPVIILNAFWGAPVPGWTELMVVVLIIGGVQMLMLAVLGEYLWRTMAESRNRPRYFIEDVTDYYEIDEASQQPLDTVRK